MKKNWTVFAAIENPALGNLGSGDDPGDILGRYLSSIWGVLFMAAGLIFIVYLVWGAIQWQIAGENQERVENAKKKIMNALVGLTIMAASWAIVTAVGHVLGISFLETLEFDFSVLAP